ncbi:hypothetical protein DV515_00004677, partial [Chloebia gouldiae]
LYYCNSLTCRIVSPGNIDPCTGHPVLVLDLYGEVALLQGEGESILCSPDCCVNFYTGLGRFP